jgi:hypothetical protein
MARHFDLAEALTIRSDAEKHGERHHHGETTRPFKSVQIHVFSFQLTFPAGSRLG